MFINKGFIYSPNYKWDGDEFFPQSGTEKQGWGWGQKFFLGWISGDGDGVKFRPIPAPFPLRN